MKRYLPILFSFVVLFACQSIAYSKEDNRKESRKEQRMRRKAEQQHLDSINHRIALLAINSNSWVLRATSVTVTGGMNVFVQPNVNFIKVTGNTIIMQTSSGFGGGPNNMGGITVRGIINELSAENDSGGIIYSFRVLSSVFNARIILTLDDYDSGASAFINFDNGRSITMTGNIIPYTASSVMEGSITN